MTSEKDKWEYQEGRVIRSRFSWWWRGGVARIYKMIFRRWPRWYSRDFRYTAEYKFVAGPTNNKQTHIFEIKEP